jgi:xanthine dehydrogenase accessory factor
VSGLDLSALRAAVAAHGPLCRVVVARVRGSAPREAGAAMLVWADGFSGTIGGGALEWEALADARRRLGRGGPDGLRSWPLGPGLGQCCGGAVTAAFEMFDAARVGAIDAGGPVHARPLGHAEREPPGAIRAHARAARAGEAGPLALSVDPAWLSERIDPARTPLWLYGAGHVGRAAVRAFADLPFAITWVDDAPARFPADCMGAAPLMAARPAEAAALAPPGAVHMVMTYSHAMDLEICHCVLSAGGFARLGVIGSASKSARFRARLRALGHGDGAIARLECPIGTPGLGGKAPAEIAISLAADLLGWRGMRGRSSAAEAAS